MDKPRKDFRRTRSATGALSFRLLAIALVLYWLGETVVGYCKGGPDAPPLAVLIASIVVLGGGAVFLAVLTWKVWKLDQEKAKLTEEEIERIEELRKED